jgi:hypothetical protein
LFSVGLGEAQHSGVNPTDLDAVKRAFLEWLQSDYDVRRMVFEAVKDEAKLEEGHGGVKSPFDSRS